MNYKIYARIPDDRDTGYYDDVKITGHKLLNDSPALSNGITVDSSINEVFYYFGVAEYYTGR